ncbi:MAG: hypothetical protein ACYS8X_10480 [Planctomycetota bacterium]|jgi:hypothetical protein
MSFKQKQCKETEVRGVTIREAYRTELALAVPASKTVASLLRGIPKKYLAGLDAIVLTDAKGLNHARRRHKTWSRKKKVKIAECLGVYHQKWNGEPAWIEIYVDNLVAPLSPLVRKVRFFREFAFADTVFHEIGHHIHRTQAPKYAEREDVAEDWEKRLSRTFFMRRYWYLVPLFFVLAIITKPFRKKKHGPGGY